MKPRTRVAAVASPAASSPAVLLEALREFECSGAVKRVSCRSIEAACAAIAAEGHARSTGGWAADRILAAFEGRALTRFFEAVSVAPADALSILADDFTEACGVIEHIGTGLNCPSLMSSFAAAVREAVLCPRVAHIEDESDADILRSTDSLCGIGRSTTTTPMVKYLRALAHRLLSMLHSTRNAALVSQDAELVPLHKLGLARMPQVRVLFADVASAAVAERVDAAEADRGQAATEPLLEWKERVVDAFADIICRSTSDSTTAAADRAFRSEWSALFTEKVLRTLGRARIGAFFDMVVEYPDSRPALIGLAQCLRRVPDLHRHLIDEGRRALAVRLHHAGTRTEDILSVLVHAVRALAALYPRGEAGAAVAEICGPTLNHLRKRRDAVSALVADMTRPPGSADALVLRCPSPEDDDAEQGTSPQRGGINGPGSSTDVLRVLLSALSLPAVVREYRSVLAQTLLQPGATEDTIDAAGEVLERMKAIFGEEALAQCMVMVRDIHASRRVNTWMNDFWARQDTAAQLRPAVRARLTVLSGTCWPPAAVKRPSRADAFIPHPAISRTADAMSKTYSEMKPSQTLIYHLAHGSATLTFRQRDRLTGESRTFDEALPLAVASALLYVGEGVTKLGDIALRMECAPSSLESQLKPLVPRLITISGNGSASSVSFQQFVQTGDGDFDVAESAEANAAPSFIAPEELQVFEKMCAAMLKTGGTKTAAQIENSIRMFGKFSGTSAQVKEVLLYLVSQNKIATPDGGATFTSAS